MYVCGDWTVCVHVRATSTAAYSIYSALGVDIDTGLGRSAEGGCRNDPP